LSRVPFRRIAPPNRAAESPSTVIDATVMNALLLIAHGSRRAESNVRAHLDDA